MDTQQMMELLLARLDGNTKTNQEMLARIEAQQEEMKARLDENAKTSLAMNEKMDANTKATLATKEDMKIMQEKIQEDLKKTMEEILAKMEKRMTATQTKTDGKLTETIEKTLTEPSQEMMQSAEEHQEVPREEAAVIPGRGRKRRHRGRKQAAGRRGEPKEPTRGDHGSRKKLAAACRKASRCATVAWRRRNVFRKSWTHGNCGLRKEVTASRKKVTRCARHRRNVQNKEKVAQRSPTGVDVGEARNAVREERTQLQSTSEGGARDSCHPWEEEDQPTRSSR
jgi:hypothetical protein